MKENRTEKRSFLWLNTTQFFGALNDNLFKLLMIFYLISVLGSEAAGEVSAATGIAFVLPFLVFSPIAGMVADRITKSKLIVAAKASEILVMAVGTLSLVTSSVVGLYVTLFLMALQSTFFSPAKYGIVPELVSREGLSRANGQLEAFTYLAIILGTTAATTVPMITGGDYRLAGFATIVIAIAGFAASLGIKENYPKPKTEQPPRPLREMIEALNLVRNDRHLVMAVLGSSLFMLVGAFVQLNLIPFGIQEFGLTQEQSGALFLLAAFGIGSGSLLAGRLSGRNAELGVVPIGATILFASATFMGVATGSLPSNAVAIVLLGVGAGLFIVPLHAFIQFRAPEEHRGKVLAVVNFLGWSGVLVAALLTHLVNVTLAQPAHVGFLGLGLILAGMTILAMVVLPDFLLRFIALVLVKIIYRVKTKNSQNIPIEGGALIVANHVSWVDAMLLLSTSQRRIRFLMEREVYETHNMRFLFKLMKVIPISSKDGRKQILESLKTARQALDEGYLVCIFAEGALTRNGTLQEFRPGFERIVKGSDHPIIPAYLGGIWGSVFSYKYGPMLSTLPKSLPGPVVISFGNPLPATSSANEVRQAVMELSSDYFEACKTTSYTLANRFVKSARKSWGKLAIADSGGTRMTYGKSLTGALLLKDILGYQLGTEKNVGILMPPSTAGSLVNIALTLSGRVAINLNYSAGDAGVQSALKQADIKTILTSKLFLKKAAIKPVGCNLIYLEEIFRKSSPVKKMLSWFSARLLPARFLLKNAAQQSDEMATIIFSSGSTAEPKGVMLSHANILSNVDALNMVFSVDSDDNVCGVLPFFHSFGYTGTLWFPLLSGFSAVYHPSPLESKQVVAAIRAFKSSFLLATPTFLSAYMRKASPDDFSSLRVAITGAEKLGRKLAEDFKEKFGIMPLEGYGATELSPVAAISLPDVEVGRVRQVGSEPESVGRPLPGVAVRITSVETGLPQNSNETGMIEISGPNVMLGYLNQPEKTNAVVKNGWYATGDIGCFNDKGFLQISGRLSRFSKIAGEMVPHGAIEDVLIEALDSAESSIAVTAVPDQKKGERIVVLHHPDAGGLEKLRKVIDNCSLPNLWKPAADSYLEVEAIPLLGSGKLDLRAIKSIAEKHFLTAEQG